MGPRTAERRRGRRVSLQAPLLIRRAGSSDKEPEGFETHLTTNVSIAGVLFETEKEKAFNQNDLVIASVSIPVEERRKFPFVRLAGPSRVVRVEKLTAQGGSGKSRFGVALEFGEDVTVLMAVPDRG